MSDIITITGGTDKSILVTVDGSDATKLVEQFRSDLQTHYSNNELDFRSLSSSDDTRELVSPLDDRLTDTMVTAGGAYNLDNNTNYVVIGEQVPNSSLGKVPGKLLTDPVTINSSMSAGRLVTVIAGNNINQLNKAGVVYNAGAEGGTFVGGAKTSPIYFAGNDKNGGNWNVVTGDGNDTIMSGSGNNTINAGGGNNIITLGTGNNTVESKGHDTITSPFDGGFNTITLKGGNSNVNVGINSVVNDVSANNVMTVGGGSTVVGGTSGTIDFSSKDSNNLNMLIGGDNNTVKASADNFHIIHGSGNDFNVTGNFRYFNGVGNTYATITGSNQDNNTQIFGADGLDFHLTAHDNNASILFVSGDTGSNQTLDGSASSSKLMIYADTTAGATNSRLMGIGGSGDDTLVGGSGYTTLTGGAGNNQFLFTNKEDDGGNTVITDFSKSKGNNIEFMNYGLNEDKLKAILDKAYNDEQGNAVLDLGNHKLTLQGVAANNLDISQFRYYNQPTKTS